MSRDERAAAEDAGAEIEARRRQIDRIDRTIVALLSERVRLGSLSADSAERIFTVIVEETAAARTEGDHD